MLDALASEIVIPRVVVVVLILAIILLVMVIWSIRRHRDPDLEIESDAPLAELMPSLSGLTQSAVYVGNTVGWQLSSRRFSSATVNTASSSISRRG